METNLRLVKIYELALLPKRSAGEFSLTVLLFYDLIMFMCYVQHLELLQWNTDKEEQEASKAYLWFG